MKKSKAPSYVTIAILSVITVFFWIIFSILRLLSAPTKISVPDEILTPLNPNLDLDTLNNLENRLFFTEAELGEGQIILPPIALEETITATESGEQ